MTTLNEPFVITELPALYPTAVFEPPLTMDDKTEHPTAVLQAPAPREVRISQPTPVVVVPEHPYKTPRNVGVASEALAEPQQMALLPFDIKTWPAVPVEAAQSMIPAPGLMALVLLPVSQLSVAEKPMANWQLPSAASTLVPMITLQLPARIEVPVVLPTKTLFAPLLRFGPDP
jgi:hypothetical protein